MLYEPVLFQEQEVLVMHLIGALLAFGLGIVYCCINAYFSLKLVGVSNSKAVALVRVALCALAIIAFVLGILLAQML